MSKKLTFQEIILTLQQYWNDQGCMLMQAYDNEKGAGTMSPYTFLRAIGPEPWNAAYVEPSRRPADGRYGENPNRLYQHHQFQGHGDRHRLLRRCVRHLSGPLQPRQHC